MGRLGWVGQGYGNFAVNWPAHLRVVRGTSAEKMVVSFSNSRPGTAVSIWRCNRFIARTNPVRSVSRRLAAVSIVSLQLSPQQG